jgi:hypothetical protein
MEIYNENVKDLLMPDSGPLRLLDDPEVQHLLDDLLFSCNNAYLTLFCFCLPLLFVLSRKEQLLRNWRSKLLWTAST